MMNKEKELEGLFTKIEKLKKQIAENRETNVKKVVDKIGIDNVYYYNGDVLIKEQSYINGKNYEYLYVPLEIVVYLLNKIK